MMAAVRLGVGIVICWEQSGVERRHRPGAHSLYHADRGK
jgi:hypothetical protein